MKSPANITKRLDRYREKTASSTGFSVRESGTHARTGSEYGAGTRGTGTGTGAKRGE